MTDGSGYALRVTVGTSLSTPRRALRLAAVLIPVLVVASVLFVAIDRGLASYDGNTTGFVQFGSAFAPFTDPPRGAIIGTGYTSSGYDGQFYYLIARDPLLLHDWTSASLRAAPQNTHSDALGSGNQAYRLQRVAYPALVSLLAGSLGLGVSTSMLAVNVLVLLVLTGGFALYLMRRGYSTIWAAMLGLLPGLLLATLRDLPDPLAIACALGGILAWTGDRRRLGVALLVVAVLTREVMMAAVLALAGQAALQSWRARDRPGCARKIVREAWPAVVLPSLVFLGWHLYVLVRAGGGVGGSGLSVPLVHFARQLGTLTTASPSLAVWQLVYLAIMLAALAVAWRSLRRGATIMSLGAFLFALAFVVAPFNDAWGEARDSLPMLALLLPLGLQRRDTACLGVCAFAAAMTAFVPLAIPGTF